MQIVALPFWKSAPALRILFAWVAGIALEYRIPLPGPILLLCMAVSLAVITVISFIPTIARFSSQPLRGICITLVLVAGGALVCRNADVRNRPGWIGHYARNAFFHVRIEEPASERQKTFRTVATVRSVPGVPMPRMPTGKLLLYFPKAPQEQLPAYGDELLIRRPPVPVTSSGNPGSFDFRRYCLFQGITHQAFLPMGSFKKINAGSGSALWRFVYGSRDRVVSILKKFIPPGTEQGLAEALLIGYKDDLDRDLVQQYANTGVVHVVAISGLHLGLVYGLLLLLCRPIRQNRVLTPIIIIGGLWLFSLMAGAQPSVLRSALMFSGIVVGKALFRKTAILNSLAFSAFVLLCINPFWLWDAGFQLSYSAVLSIVLFMQPIYRLLTFSNRLLNGCWQMMAVTLAAQVLTFPICAYQFHQFPVYFLLTNFVAVPLSSLILILEITLCIISPWHAAATWIGLLIRFLVATMNGFVKNVAALPFSVWGNWQLNGIQLILLFLLIAFIVRWLICQRPNLLLAGLSCLVAFFGIRAVSFLVAERQQQLIVYSIPGVPVIDVVAGRTVMPVACNVAIPQSYILPTARSVLRANFCGPPLQPPLFIRFGKIHVGIMDAKTACRLPPARCPGVLVLTSVNSPAMPHEMAEWRLKLVVFSSGCRGKTLRQWKENCAQSGVPFYDVTEKGAFVMRTR